MHFAQGTMGRFGGEEVRRLSVEFISVLPWAGTSPATTGSAKKRNDKNRCATGQSRN